MAKKNGARSKKELNELLSSMVSDEDIKEVFQQLIRHARLGEQWAIKEFNDRMLGKPQQNVDVSVEQRATVADLPALKQELAELVKSDPELKQMVDRPLIEQDGSESPSQ